MSEITLSQKPTVLADDKSTLFQVHSHDTRTADNYRLINIKLNVRKHYEIFWDSHLEHDPHGYTVVQISWNF